MKDFSLTKEREALCRVCRLLYHRGYVVGHDGNVSLRLGEIPVAPFAMPSTGEVPESIRPLVQGHSGVLLANHGALTWGRELWEAFDRMETVEQTARIYALVHLMGGGAELTPEQAEGLLALSGRYQRLAGRRERQEEEDRDGAQ